MYFDIKNYLKSNCYHITQYTLSVSWVGTVTYLFTCKNKSLSKKKKKPLIFKLINVSRDECVEQKRNARG